MPQTEGDENMGLNDTKYFNKTNQDFEQTGLQVDNYDKIQQFEENLNEQINRTLQKASRAFEVKLKAKRRRQKTQSFEDQEREINKHLKIIDTVVALVAIIIGVVTYNEGEVAISVNTFMTEVEVSSLNGNNEIVTSTETVDRYNVTYISNAQTDQYRMAMVFFTFILNFLILIRYQRLLKRMKVQRLIPPKAGCWRAGLVPKLFLELIICSTISPPGVNFTFSGKLDGGSYQYRIYWHYCSWNTNAAIRVGKRHDQKIDLIFAIKSELKYRPFVMVGFIMVVSIFYLGFIIRTCEFVSYFFLCTFFGRFFGVLSFIVGNVLISLIVVVLSNETNFEPAEAKAYNTLKKEMAQDKALGRAADVIRTSKLQFQNIYEMRLEQLQDRVDRMDRAMSRISNIERRMALFFIDLNNKVYEQEAKLKEIERLKKDGGAKKQLSGNLSKANTGNISPIIKL